MKKIIIALLIIVSLGAVFTGCSKKGATWLEDGQTLEVIDNTLGEGEPNNLKFTHTYTNSTVNESKGYIYTLPVSESNPTARYFASIKQGTESNSSKLVEITNIKNGDKLTPDNFLSFESLWTQGMQFIDGNSTAVHYSSAVTVTKYCYNVTNNTITVWGDKYLTVTITSSAVSGDSISFEVEIKDFMKLPMILSHKGDSWQIK